MFLFSLPASFVILSEMKQGRSREREFLDEADDRSLIIF